MHKKLQNLIQASGNTHYFSLGKVLGISFWVTFLFILIGIFVPLSPNMPWEGVEHSWVLGMNQATGQGLEIGKDIIFTFGPYASIYTKTFHPSTDGLMVLGSLYYAVSFFIVLYLLFRQSNLFFKAALLFLLVAINSYRDEFLLIYPLCSGVLVFQLTTWWQDTKVKLWNKTLLLFLVFAPFGLLPLIKGSALIACFLIAALSILLLLKDKKNWPLAFFVMVMPIISSGLFWVISGQSIVNLPEYFTSIFPIIRGYSGAMSLIGNVAEVYVFIFSALLIILALMIYSGENFYRRNIVCLMFFFTLFLAFKLGFVRHDAHALVAGSTLVFVSLIAYPILPRRKSLGLIIVSLSAWFFISLNYGEFSISSIGNKFNEAISKSINGLSRRIFDRESLINSYKSRLSAVNTIGKLPFLEGTSDIYSYDQAYLISSGNSWNPRPIFQSYSAYEVGLLEKNKTHITGSSRPDNIFFKIQNIDNRLPTLEEGNSLPFLLSRYMPTGFLNGFIFLKALDGKGRKEKVDFLSEQSQVMGEKVFLPETKSLILAKIYTSQTFLGKLFGVLFKPSQLYLMVNMDDGSQKKYRLISEMAKSEFILSPLIENTEDFSSLYMSVNLLGKKKVRSISVVADEQFAEWNKDFRIQFFSFDYTQDLNFSKVFNYNSPKSLGLNQKKIIASQCEGSIDFINGALPASNAVKINYFFRVHGWLAKDLRNSSLPDKVYLVLEDKKGELFSIPTNKTQRSDVGNYFNSRALDSTGYETMAVSAGLTGKYILHLGFYEDGDLKICPQFNVDLSISGL